VLPAAVRSALGLTPGTRMLLSTEADGSLRLRPYRAIAARAPGGLLAERVAAAGSLVDERRVRARRARS
jgi:hypothetical protein